jgi:hypothetical protein
MCVGTSELTTRVFSKQTNKNFGSNRNKPKQDVFQLCFGLFHETINKKFRFVSVCFGLFRCFEPTVYQNKRNKQNCFNKLKPTGTTQNFLKNTKICSLSNCFGWPSVCLGSIEILKLSVSVYSRSETTKTNVLFRIVTKLVSGFPVSVVLNRN